MAKLPRSYEVFKRAHPELWQIYDRLGALAHAAGPLDKKSRALVKLAMAIGARMEGAVHAHVRRATEDGATPAVIRHVALLGLTTLGFPSTMAVLTWIEDVLGSQRGKKKRS